MDPGRSADLQCLSSMNCKCKRVRERETAKSNAFLLLRTHSGGLNDGCGSPSSIRDPISERWCPLVRERILDSIDHIHRMPSCRSCSLTCSVNRRGFLRDIPPALTLPPPPRSGPLVRMPSLVYSQPITLTDTLLIQIF